MRTTKPRETGQLPWPLVWNWLNPAMGAQAAYNTKLHGAIVVISSEWQTFVGQRLNEDLHLMRELGAAKTPEQIWTTSARFWQKAAEDYAHEYATMAKLVGDCAIGGVSAAQGALQAQPEVMPPLSKAA
ncbi:MAG: hypothetical protein HC869_00770 [Rhodospirillales bacterium]|nr:hypothetical protein [Rhodospirillales bacterium]